MNTLLLPPKKRTNTLILSARLFDYARNIILDSVLSMSTVSQAMMSFSFCFSNPDTGFEKIVAWDSQFYKSLGFETEPYFFGFGDSKNSWTFCMQERKKVYGVSSKDEALWLETHAWTEKDCLWIVGAKWGTTTATSALIEKVSVRVQEVQNMPNAAPCGGLQSTITLEAMV